MAVAQTPAATGDAAQPPATTDAKPAAKPADGAKKATPQDVTVTAKRSEFTSSIDRHSYSLANDLQKTSGSMADVLRNVPQVEVDLQGNVKLRGDANVTILVDGKPSALFNNQSRADALQQMPADQIERVEVITTPSAEFRPDGTGGIINLITKKGGKAPPFSGSIKANIGNEGRYNFSLRMARSENGLTLSGVGSFSHNVFAQDGHTDRQIIGTGGGATHITTDNHYSGESKFALFNGSAQYQLDAKTRFDGGLTLYDGIFDGRPRNRYRSDALIGPLAQDYDTTGKTHGFFRGQDLSTAFTKTLPGDGHEFSASFQLTNFANRYESAETYAYSLPIQQNRFENLVNDQPQRGDELKIQYKNSYPGDAKLTLGYQLNADWNRVDRKSYFGAGSADATLSSALSNLFKLSQTVHALYATYQRPFGPLTVQPGLRLEETTIDIDQVTSAIKDHYDYFRAYPTLHMGYKLDDNRQLSFGYSRRVERPGTEALNPYRIYNGPLSFNQGNSRLKPAITDSFEAGFEYRKRSTYMLTTVFYRSYKDQFTQITQDLGGGVTLSSQANLGRNDETGIEFVANRELTKAISYNVSATALNSQIDPGGLAASQRRSGTVLSGRATVNWTVTPVDFIQMGFSGRGHEPSAQGYSGGYFSANFGYRHKLNDKLALVVTAQNPFYTSRGRSYTQTPTLIDRTVSQNNYQPIYIGFTYALGAPNKRAPDQFDFGGGGAPGGGGPR